MTVYVGDYEQTLAWAMKHPDRWVCEIVYRDQDGKRTRRVISPIRYTPGRTHIVALCLARESPRQFVIAKISDCRLINANQVLMPVEIKDV